MATTKKKTEAGSTPAVETIPLVVDTVSPAVAATEEKPARRTRKAAAKKEETAPTAKKTRCKTAATKVVIQLAGKDATSDDLVARAKADWVSKGNDATDITSLNVYLNAGEGMVYYVVNDDYLSGSFDF